MNPKTSPSSYIRRQVRYFLIRIGLIKLQGTPPALGEKRGLSRRLPRKVPAE